MKLRAYHLTYLVKADDPYASREDNDDVPERNRGSRHGHGDHQEHQDQPGGADTLDSSQCSVGLGAVIPSSSRHQEPKRIGTWKHVGANAKTTKKAGDKGP